MFAYVKAWSDTENLIAIQKKTISTPLPQSDIQLSAIKG